MRIARNLLDEITRHASECDPAECSGFLKLREGEVVEVVPGRNLAEHTALYSMDPDTVLAATLAEDEGFEIALYHSHPRNAPMPSNIDLAAATYPDWPMLILGRPADPRTWSPRAWKLVNPPEEIELTVR